MLKALHLWLPAYLARNRRPTAAVTTDILLCVCDHFEAGHGVTRQQAIQRVARWRDDFPKLSSSFTDADGIHPRHTFFFPIEQYDRDILDILADLCRHGYGETEIHLHHRRDTPEGLRKKLIEGKQRLVDHGLLCRDANRTIRYGFIHGNWALDNSDPSEDHCGVNTELSLLSETGCYADFTMPSAPHPTQTRTINSIYYAIDSPAPKSHDRGIPAQVHRAAPSTDALLMVQGPLGLNWHRRKYGLFPRIENGELAGNHPPTPDRMRIWLNLGIHVRERPEWVVIKLHTHGCDDRRHNPDMLLGEPMRQFHALLADRFNDGRRYRLHYVTARELTNILHAAEDGHEGNPGAFRNYRYTSLIGA